MGKMAIDKMEVDKLTLHLNLVLSSALKYQINFSGTLLNVPNCFTYSVVFVSLDICAKVYLVKLSE